MKKIRCAIYTRKSSEEGLEQDFNSLHAQREACASYVKSQASEGWSNLPEHYDDGGLSGGTLERPALKRLMGDIEAGKIDIVVVYKVDRLTRSLLDFAKLVEAFDKAGTSFVSVTQSFNTTTSMGRLTLNMLLSFAQFEREVTAERIRDKIAASKARGMWMGGNPPLGYQPDGRSLAIVEEHAAVVRDIFKRYISIGNVRLLANELIDEYVHVPERTTGTGRPMGGGSFSRGQLYKLLSNPIYVGEIHHRGAVHAAKHEAIIDRDTWNTVQQRLVDNCQGTGSVRSAAPSLLAGLLFDAAGEPLVAAHACKGKVRYRYYVSRSLQHDPDAIRQNGVRIPAREIEALVTARVAEAIDDPLRLLAEAGIALDANELPHLLRLAEKLAAIAKRKDRTTIRKLVARITVVPKAVRIDLAIAELAKQLGVDTPAENADTISLSSAARLTRTGRAIRLIQSNGRAANSSKPDPSLVQLLVRARGWWAELATGEIDIASLARREKLSASWMSRVVRLNFLAPSIAESIIAGTQPAHLDAKKLTSGGAFPIDWNKQVGTLAGL